MGEADTMARPVMARQRWFISTTEAERIKRPRLKRPEKDRASTDDWGAQNAS
jgi:hypothetical protein